MENWQFLLQKEEDELNTDRSASSLLKASNNSTIAIEEGRYRIIAHSNRSNVDVEIDISHQIVNTGKSLRRSQKRSRSTNESGLVVILPFTNLQPGWWEIECSGELLSFENRRAWHKKLEMQVYPKSDRQDLDVVRSQDDKKQTERQEYEEEIAIAANLNHPLTNQSQEPETSARDTREADTNSSTEDRQIDRSSQTTSSVNVNLFDPKKVSQESRHTQPLTSQILPPKIAGNEENFQKQPFQEYSRSQKPIELPKVNLPKIEPISFSQLSLSIQQTEENLTSTEGERLACTEYNHVEGLNLQQRFWSLINSLASDSSKETGMDEEE
jgi:hypothetical protein